jgi:hypothetical protein
MKDENSETSFMLKNLDVIWEVYEIWREEWDHGKEEE